MSDSSNSLSLKRIFEGKRIVGFYEMDKIAGGMAVLASQMLELAAQTLMEENPIGLKLNSVKSNLSLIEHCFRTLGLSVCLDLLGEIQHSIKTLEPNVAITLGYQEIRGLQKAFISEADSLGLFLMTPDEVKWYNDELPFGKEVYKKFPQIKEESIEASKSLSVARYTACGMHCMRILERVVELLAKKAGVPFFDSNNQPMGWHKLIQGIQAKVDSISANAPKSKAKYKGEMSLALSHLSLSKHVRNALQHPHRTLFDYEARGCFEGTRHFLGLVARQNLLRKTALHLK